MNAYSSHSDQLLVRLLEVSDRDAFTEIYNRYWDRLFYVAGKKIKDLYEAESMVQDLFLDLWQRRQTLEVEGELSHYLAVAMKYKIINFQARKERAARYVSQHAAEADRATEEWLSFNELKGRLDKLVTQLPQKCRLAYELREEGLTQKEIATSMGVSENTVETHIGRALKFLRSGLTHIFFFL